MKIGKISKNEKIISVNKEINCTKCGKSVPGGLKTGENYSKTKEFEKDVNDFLENYLCGICRDKKRLENN